MKVWLICGGGDWADASAELVVPYRPLERHDMEQFEANHRSWYEERYLPAFRRGENPRYYSFVEWLKIHGIVREPTTDEAETFEEV